MQFGSSLAAPPNVNLGCELGPVLVTAAAGAAGQARAGLVTLRVLPKGGAPSAATLTLAKARPRG